MITVVELGAADILVCSIPVGSMPPTKTAEYLDKVKASMKDLLGDETKLLMLPVRDWDARVEMAIIKRVV